jgi:hypothetical protein
MSDDAQADTVRYSFKPSLAGSPLAFGLTEQGLTVQTGFRSGTWHYADITQIRLTYRPVSMLAHRFRADIRHKDGRKVTVISATWTGIVTLSPQNDSYRAFIEELHRRMIGREVVCLAGLGIAVFAMGLALFAAVMIALTGLFIRALTAGDFIAALFMLGFAGWFGWHTGGWLMRNRPGRYDPANVPRQLLP